MIYKSARSSDDQAGFPLHSFELGVHRHATHEGNASHFLAKLSELDPEFFNLKGEFAGWILVDDGNICEGAMLYRNETMGTSARPKNSAMAVPGNVWLYRPHMAPRDYLRDGAGASGRQSCCQASTQSC